MTFLNENIVRFIFLSFQLLSFLFGSFLSSSDRISFLLVSLPLSLVLKRHPEGSNSFPSVDTSFLSKFLMMYQKLPKKEGMYQIRIKSLSLESTRKIFDLVSFPSTLCCPSKIISHFFLFPPYGWLIFSTDHYIFSSCSATFFLLSRLDFQYLEKNVQPIFAEITREESFRFLMKERNKHEER